MRVVPDREGGAIVFNDKCVKIGYVEGGTLYGIGADGYADPIGEISHNNEIEQRLAQWLLTHSN